MPHFFNLKSGSNSNIFLKNENAKTKIVVNKNCLEAIRVKAKKLNATKF
jgi:orotate phosphoribosyltransferase